MTRFIHPYLHLIAPDWTSAAIAIGVLVGALVLAAIVHTVTFALLTRMAARPGRVVETSLVHHARRPSRWVLPLLALLIVVPVLPLAVPLRAGLQHLIGLGVIAAVAWSVILTADILADLLTARHSVEAKDNLAARRIQTQVAVLRRVLEVVVVLITLAVMLMTFPTVRTIGTSLLASAGLAGLVIGMAMKPTLSSLIAGIQIALTQPIRMEDAVIVEGEYGWIEEITATYVVVRLWDWRRMVLPLTYFIETPFQNWTRTTANILGSVYLFMDYSVPLDELRAELERIVHASTKWNKQVCVLQVSDATEHSLQLRALADAADAGQAWDLRCEIREGLIRFLQKNYPHALPKTRAQLEPEPAMALPTAKSSKSVAG